MNDNAQVMAKTMMILAPAAGRTSLLLFVIFLFSGSLNLVKMELSETAALILNGMLSMAFFIQHSTMIRRRFRTGWSRFFPSHYVNAVYTIISSIVLTALVLLWQPSATMLVVQQGFLRWMARGVFFLALAGIVWGVFALKSFDPFGRMAIKAHLSDNPPLAQRFLVKGPYLWVRHPLYFFVLLLVWSFPDLSADRLLFNILWTAWIYVGTLLEEKDLVADFGDDYRRYQRNVPMLIPWHGRATQ